MPKFPYPFLLGAALLAAASCIDAGLNAGAQVAARAPAVENHDVASDLSREREADYTRSVRQWLEGLPPNQREQARKILQEAKPGVHALRERIRETKARLEALRFDSATPTDTLPRLGLELQMLRNQLRQRLLQISDLLRNEVGVPMGPLGDEGFWLNPGVDDSRAATRVSTPARP